VHELHVGAPELLPDPLDPLPEPPLLEPAGRPPELLEPPELLLLEKSLEPELLPELPELLPEPAPEPEASGSGAPGALVLPPQPAARRHATAAAAVERGFHPK
jgi:hypothetical protein